VADVEQLLDVSADPSAKSRLLSGGFNIVQCPLCGFHGMLGMPIVYHDPAKELLLTYVPAELGLPMQEQERIIGPLINKVVNNLPQEKRKAYLLRPQSMLTMQGLVERVLEADGITKEMIQAQQQRMSLLQRLLSASSDEVQAEIIKQEEAQFDAEFFMLLGRLGESAMAAGDQEATRRLGELQKKLVELTTFGREIQAQSSEVEAAVRSLQAVGKRLTRDKLLDLVVQAPSMARVSALVSLTRPGMDYEFFQMLSERIAQAAGSEKDRLLKLRERLLELIREVDQQVQARMEHARKLLDTILQAGDVSEAMLQNLQMTDEWFVQALNAELEATRKRGDLDRIGKLQQVMAVLQQASAPPPEVELIEALLDAPDDQALRALLDAHRQEITPEFTEVLTSLVNQTQSQDNADPEMKARIQRLFELVLQMSMQANLKS
jgi:hypothetical protein